MPTDAAAALLVERNISAADELADAAMMLGAELPPVSSVPELTGPLTLEGLAAVVADLHAVCRALDQRQRLLARLILKRP